MVYDHEGEFALRSGHAPCFSHAEMVAHAKTGVIVYDPSQQFAGDLQGGWDFFCAWCFEFSANHHGTKLFCCDELQKLTATSQFAPDFAAIVETGRRRGIDCAFVCQQPNRIHNCVRNQVTHVVTFRQADARSIGWFEDFGIEPDEIRQLSQGEYIQLIVPTGEKKKLHFH